jgi:F-type H+-transporting ATPase subunit a
MRALRSLLPVLGLWLALVLGGSACAQGDHGTATKPDAAAATQGDEHGAQAHKSTLEMTPAEVLGAMHAHSVPHPVWPAHQHGEAPAWYTFYNVNQWQWISIVIVLLIMVNVASSFARPGKPGWIAQVFRGWCRWIRDEMVYSVMGKEHGRPFVPFFLFLFFFVTGQNVIGMIPSVHGAFEPTTATGTPYVTAPMALVTFAMMLGFGMRQNGVLGFWKGLLPHGLPVALIPLMIVVELIGLVVKPFALCVRLFANMLAGHLVIASVIGLIFVFTIMFKGSALSYVTAVPALGMAAFIFIIESFIVLLQAYVFTYLSIIFLHQAIHQEH